MTWDRILFLVLFGAAMFGVWIFAKWSTANWGWTSVAVVAIILLPIYWFIDRRSKPDSE